MFYICSYRGERRGSSKPIAIIYLMNALAERIRMITINNFMITCNTKDGSSWFAEISFLQLIKIHYSSSVINLNSDILILQHFSYSIRPWVLGRKLTSFGKIDQESSVTRFEYRLINMYSLDFLFALSKLDLAVCWSSRILTNRFVNRLFLNSALKLKGMLACVLIIYLHGVKPVPSWTEVL